MAFQWLRLCRGDSEGGLLAPSDAAATPAAAIARLRDDPALRAKLADGGYAYAQRAGDIEVRTREIEAVYGEVVGHMHIGDAA